MDEDIVQRVIDKHTYGCDCDYKTKQTVIHLIKHKIIPKINYAGVQYVHIYDTLRSYAVSQSVKIMLVKILFDLGMLRKNHRYNRHLKKFVELDNCEILVTFLDLMREYYYWNRSRWYVKALSHAVRTNKHDIVEYLLKNKLRGADMPIRQQWGYKNLYGTIFQHALLLHRDPKMVQLLLDYDADPHLDFSYDYNLNIRDGSIAMILMDLHFLLFRVLFYHRNFNPSECGVCNEEYIEKLVAHKKKIKKIDYLNEFVNTIRNHSQYCIDTHDINNAIVHGSFDLSYAVWLFNARKDVVVETTELYLPLVNIINAY